MKKLILAVMAVIILSFSALSQRQHVIFESLFDGTDYTKEWSQKEQCFPNSIQQSSTVFRSGKSIMFTSKSIDSLTCNLVRSQLISNTWPAKNDLWYGFSVMFGDGYPDDYDGLESILQFFRDTSELNVPMSLDYHGDYDYITFTTRLMEANDRNKTIMEYHYSVAPVTHNVWHDIVMHIKFADDSTGRVRIWVDGNYVFGVNGINNYTPNILRIGIDKWDWRKNMHISTTDHRILYMDEFRIGDSLATYNDVAPNPFIAIPVKYIKDLTAVKVQKRVRLNWEATMTDDFVRFDVERSVGNSYNFIKIGEVQKNSIGDYQYFDENPNQLNYYRLKEVNTNPNTGYSKIARISFEIMQIKVSVFNVLGQLIKIQTVTNGSPIMPQLKLRQGVYILKYEDGTVEKVGVMDH